MLEMLASQLLLPCSATKGKESQTLGGGGDPPPGGFRWNHSRDLQIRGTKKSLLFLRFSIILTKISHAHTLDFVAMANVS